MSNIKKIIVKNYRAIDFLEFSPKKVNIIVGPNNTGKSSLLNAISLILFGINQFKSDEFTNNFDRRKLYPLNRQIYDNNDNITEISLELENTDNPIRSVKLEMQFSKESVPKNIQGESFSLYHDSELDDRIKEEFKESEKYIDYDEKAEYIPEDIKRRIKEVSNRIRSDMMRSFRKTLYFKLFLNNDLMLESYIPRRLSDTRYFYRRPTEDFLIYYKNINTINSLRNNIHCDFIYRSQLERFTINQYFKKLLNSPKFYDVLEKLKQKIYYIYDIREIEGQVNIVIKKNDKDYLFIPFNLMGDGFQSLIATNIVFELFEKGVVLLEEPENSLHPGYMDIMTDNMINRLSKTQYFFSTHSLDLIKFIIEKAEKTHNLDKVLILRLSRNQNRIDREILLEKDILQELEEIKIDLRGY